MLQNKIMKDPASPLYGRLDIYIVDNGRTLDREDIVVHNRDSSFSVDDADVPSNSDDEGKVFLIPNYNAGGSGGFTRGMLEILQQKRLRDTRTSY
jgi:GT2 family glycosyltransferase